MQSLSDQDIPGLAQALARQGHKPSNAARVLRQLWSANGSLDLDRLPISRCAREFLRADFAPPRSRVVLRHRSKDGTVKLLVGFDQVGLRREAVECVLMPSHRPDRAAACISSQIGC